LVEVKADVIEGVKVGGAAVVDKRVSVIVGVSVLVGIKAALLVSLAETVSCTEVMTICASGVEVGEAFDPRQDESTRAAIIKNQILLRMYKLQI